MQVYVLMNNRLEGNAPLTVQALTDLLRRESDPGQTLRGETASVLTLRR